MRQEGFFVDYRSGRGDCGIAIATGSNEVYVDDGQRGARLMGEGGCEAYDRTRNQGPGIASSLLTHERIDGQQIVD